VVRFLVDRVAVFRGDFLAPVRFFVARVAFFVPVFFFVVARFLVDRFLVVRFFVDRVAFFFAVRFFVVVRFLVDRVAFFGERFVVFLATFFFGAIFLPPVLWIPSLLVRSVSLGYRRRETDLGVTSPTERS
jgi:hypothetical protein